jgi:ATP/maltotriose-dependent transcriptional regulator MalT
MGTSTSTSAQFASLTSEKLFDYFANEIFNKTDSSIQDVLLKTSFLQKIDSEMAEQLTGNAMAGQLLDRMSLNQYFTRKYGQAYQYHPLFREFLQSRAKANISPADIVALKQKAAGLLEQSGNEEEAVALYIKAADWGATERIVLKQAPVLVSQGRSHTLAGWLHSLPPGSEFAA